MAAEDPFASDGSDYELLEELISGVEDDEMSYESEEIFGEPQPPPPPRYEDMSVEELQRLLKQHKEARTVHQFLTTIDLGSDMYVPTYSKPRSLSESPRLRSKSYRSILHFACMDEDGLRGEQKIRMILEAAKQAHVDVRQILLACHQEVTPGSNAEDVPYTPLHDLLSNDNSTVESARMICQAWPRVVHTRDIRGPNYAGTHLCYILLDRDNDGVERRVALVKVLLKAAEKTNEGARGLVSAIDQITKGMNPDVYDYYDMEEVTALHTVTTYQSNPEHFLPLLLQAWPDALKHCRVSNDRNHGSAPLHNVARYSDEGGYCHVKSYVSRMKCIEAFLQYSSLDALAFGLLYTDEYGCLGFHLVRGAIEQSDAEDYCPRLRSYMEATVKVLVRKKDQGGRSLLHYIAASSDEVSEAELYRKLRRLTYDEAPVLEEFDFDLDPSNDVCAAWQQEREKLEKRNLGYMLEVCQWILSIDEATAFVRDSEGMNPFHFAMINGRQWDAGLKELATLVPDWPRSCESVNRLYPFMLAALSDDGATALSDGAAIDDIDTIYGLLRYDCSILQHCLGV